MSVQLRLRILEKQQAEGLAGVQTADLLWAFWALVGT